MAPKSTWKFPNVLIPPFWRRKDIAPPPLDVPASTIDLLNNPKDKKDLERRLVGLASMMPQQEMMRVVGDALSISYFRRNFYRECEDSVQHAFVQGAVDLYTDSACGFSSVNNATVWVTSPDEKTENTLNQFLSYIHIEERVRDWASTLTMLGDVFIECIGREGIGIGYIDDNIHPADMDRVDINGRLEGFMRTALLRSAGAGSNLQLQAPWQYVHGRVFGIQQRLVNSTLGVFGEPGRRFQIGIGQSPDMNYRVTTRYGVPIIAPAVYVYKRLKMSEDSVLLARISRGIMWLLYKIKTKGVPFDQAVTITQAFADMLKRQKGQNTTVGSEQWKDKFLPILSQVEDMFVPETEDIEIGVEELGGNVDIKGIVDVDMLESRLLGALRVSRSMLGLTDQLPGSIGEGSANRISINFAKNAQRLQTSLRQMIARMCQIHLAYLGLDSDPTNFDVHLAEISSAEEEELKNALNSGIDAVDKLIDVFYKAAGEENINKYELLQYLNQKILKLDDIELSKLLVGVDKGKKEFAEASHDVVKNAQKSRRTRGKRIIEASDMFAYLPSIQNGGQLYVLNEGKAVKRDVTWNSMKIKILEWDGQEGKGRK